MYPLNPALEDMLQAVRGRCPSEADATNSGIQVAVKLPATQFNLIVADICEHGNLSVGISGATAKFHYHSSRSSIPRCVAGSGGHEVSPVSSAPHMQCDSAVTTVLNKFEVIALNKLNHTVNSFDGTCIYEAHAAHADVLQYSVGVVHSSSISAANQF